MHPDELLNLLRRARRDLESARTLMRGIRAELEDEQLDLDAVDELVDRAREIEETLMLGEDDDGQ